MQAGKHTQSLGNAIGGAVVVLKLLYLMRRLEC
jgi:hypothetical protein